MSNYFFLGLDTTPPEIEIYAPNYTNRLTNDEIRVEASEPLMEFQNIYVVDATGNKHDLILYRESEKVYVGQLTFSGYPFGIATIFAQLKDEVGNPSRLASFNINIVPVYNSYSLNMTLTELVSGVNLSEGTNSLTMSEQIQNLILSDKDMTSTQLTFKLWEQSRDGVEISDNNRVNLKIYDADA